MATIQGIASSDDAEKRPSFLLDHSAALAPFIVKNITTMRSVGVFYEDPLVLTEMELVHPTHDYTVVIYSAILAFGVLANLYLIITSFRTGKLHPSKAHSHLFHVVFADLIICLFAIPIEIGWRWTIEWRGGNTGCKVLQFARVIGLYALTHHLTAIAVDKVVEVKQLMMGGFGSNVTKCIFAFSWMSSTLCSLPQLFVFQAGYSQFSTTIVQCVGMESFASHEYEHLYNIFMLSCMFLLPWAIMIACYIYIFHIVKSTQDMPDDIEQYVLTSPIQVDSSSGSGPQTRTRVFSMGQQSRTSMMSSWGNPTFSQHTMSTTLDTGSVSGGDFPSHIHLRSNQGNFILLDDSFERDLKIFSTISGTAVLTCLPYISFTIWYLIDSHSHSQIHPILQELPFVLVLLNTLLIPAVYALKLCATY